jgi:hypothetical protein
MAAVNALAERLRAVHKPYAGARFRAAFLKQGSLRFLTGSVVFCPDKVPSRAIADYGSLVLVEQWQQDQGEALTLLSKLLSGQADIAGQKVGSGFQQSDLEHRPYTFTSRMWSGWEMRSHYDCSDPYGQEQPQPLIQDSILGFGLRPYRGGNQAINDWVFDLVNDNIGGAVPDFNALVTFLPDTRARVVSALWTPGKLNLELEINVPPEQVELQIIHVESIRSPQARLATSGAFELEIPDDTRELLIYLVHKSGECIMHIHLRSVYGSFGHVPEDLTTRSRAESDLAKGEGDQIEFKPFISPRDPKEGEIVDTAIRESSIVAQCRASEALLFGIRR